MRLVVANFTAVKLPDTTYRVKANSSQRLGESDVRHKKGPGCPGPLSITMNVMLFSLERTQEVQQVLRVAEVEVVELHDDGIRFRSGEL